MIGNKRTLTIGAMLCGLQLLAWTAGASQQEGYWGAPEAAAQADSDGEVFTCEGGHRAVFWQKAPETNEWYANVVEVLNRDVEVEHNDLPVRFEAGWSISELRRLDPSQHRRYVRFKEEESLVVVGKLERSDEKEQVVACVSSSDTAWLQDIFQKGQGAEQDLDARRKAGTHAICCRTRAAMQLLASSSEESASSEEDSSEDIAITIAKMREREKMEKRPAKRKKRMRKVLTKSIFTAFNLQERQLVRLARRGQAKNETLFMYGVMGWQEKAGQKREELRNEKFALQKSNQGDQGNLQQMQGKDLENLFKEFCQRDENLEIAGQKRMDGLEEQHGIDKRWLEKRHDDAVAACKGDYNTQLSHLRRADTAQLTYAKNLVTEAKKDVESAKAWEKNAIEAKRKRKKERGRREQDRLDRQFAYELELARELDLRNHCSKELRSKLNKLQTISLVYCWLQHKRFGKIEKKVGYAEESHSIPHKGADKRVLSVHNTENGEYGVCKEAIVLIQEIAEFCRIYGDQKGILPQVCDLQENAPVAYCYLWARKGRRTHWGMKSGSIPESTLKQSRTGEFGVCKGALELIRKICE